MELNNQARSSTSKQNANLAQTTYTTIALILAILIPLTHGETPTLSNGGGDRVWACTTQLETSWFENPIVPASGVGQFVLCLFP